MPEPYDSPGRRLLGSRWAEAELDARSRGWRLVAWLIAVFAAGPLFLVPGIVDLTEHSSLWQVVHGAWSTGVGLGFIGQGLPVLGYVLLRLYRRGRASR